MGRSWIRLKELEVCEKQKPSPCQLNLTIKRKRRPKLPGGRLRRQNNRKMPANLRHRREKNRRLPRLRKTRRLATLTNQTNKIPAVQVHIKISLYRLLSLFNKM